jgi:hypothetical protein
MSFPETRLNPREVLSSNTSHSDRRPYFDRQTIFNVSV